MLTYPDVSVQAQYQVDPRGERAKMRFQPADENRRNRHELPVSELKIVTVGTVNDCRVSSL